ncbi:MAG: F0F1 ATP synthase subunit epsilon [Rhizobiales bacterium]|nr:F0F1 ATP synthase subunit epsilon [Hyphomicrobiales bacterium]NRB14669.1 F0F1 ATP synthase subunit epsilon [Hyphomicrobiales bacterium]
MAEKLNFELVSPAKLLISESVDSVVVPGTEGDFGVFINHAPMMSTLRVGFLEVVNGSNTERFFVKGGFAEVGDKGLSVLAEQSVKVEDLTKDLLDAEIKNVEAALENAAEDTAKAALAYSLNQLNEILETL